MTKRMSGPALTETVKSCTPSVPAWRSEVSRAIIVMSSSPLVPLMVGGVTGKSTPAPEIGEMLSIWS